MDRSVVVMLEMTIPGQSVSIESDPIGGGAIESDPIACALRVTAERRSYNPVNISSTL
jgi:hypothetical protein